MIANLESQTGRSLEQWTRLVGASSVEGFTSQVNWLKQEHGLGHFQARLVVEEDRLSATSGSPDPDTSE